MIGIFKNFSMVIKKFPKMEGMSLIIYFMKSYVNLWCTLDNEYVSTFCCSSQLHLSLDNVVYFIRGSTMVIYRKPTVFYCSGLLEFNDELESQYSTKRNTYT